MHNNRHYDYACDCTRTVRCTKCVRLALVNNFHELSRVPMSHDAKICNEAGRHCRHCSHRRFFDTLLCKFYLSFCDNKTFKLKKNPALTVRNYTQIKLVRMSHIPLPIEKASD
jgi:hypothetical protein